MLFNPSNPEEGGEGCFSFPEKCLTIYAALEQRLKKLDINKLTAYMNNGLKYKLATYGNFKAYLKGDN